MDTSSKDALAFCSISPPPQSQTPTDTLLDIPAHAHHSGLPAICQVNLEIYGYASLTSVK